MTKLPTEEYLEQAYVFQALGERINPDQPLQDLLQHVRDEVLATTRLPLAIDYVLAELKHVGTMSTAMARMTHYFAPFQSYLVAQAEGDRTRLDMTIAMKVLEREARLRADDVPPTTLFCYQFEVLCRNRLGYDEALSAMAGDPHYPAPWRPWLLDIRKKIGWVDLADLVYVHSQYYELVQQRAAAHESPVDGAPAEPARVVLFGEKEGRIALANRRKEPLYFFAALQRQLGYPTVPRLEPRSLEKELLPKLDRLVRQLELRVKLLEDEQRAKGIDLSQFFEKPGGDARSRQP